MRAARPFEAFWPHDHPPGLDELLGRPEWQEHGACRHHRDLTWFPVTTTTAAGKRMVDAAKQVCAECPIVDQRRSYALERPAIVGVWGATTTGERAVIRKRQNGAIRTVNANSYRTDLAALIRRRRQATAVDRLRDWLVADARVLRLPAARILAHGMAGRS